jgi:hypothetical protein
MAKRKLVDRKVKAHSRASVAAIAPNSVAQDPVFAPRHQDGEGTHEMLPDPRPAIADHAPAAAALPAAGPAESALSTALAMHEASQREIDVLRAAVDARFEELHRLTRSYRQMAAKAHEALRDLQASQSLLAERDNALANAAACLAQKDAEILAAEKARVELVECFHVAVASSHRQKSLEDEKKKPQSRLRAKKMERSEEWILLNQSWLFDGDWYLKRYPDVAQAAWEPVEHYLSFGAKEHRNPSPFFCTASYLKENADVAKAEINPLFHYIKFGCHESRRAVPRLIK